MRRVRTAKLYRYAHDGAAARRGRGECEVPPLEIEVRAIQLSPYRAGLAVFRDGVWYVRQSTGGDTGFAFGLPSDIPVAGDYDGDGRSDLAVYREGIWYYQRSTAGFGAIAFGLPEDRPVPAAFH